MSTRNHGTRPHLWWGVTVALLSAASFATAGVAAKPLLLAGWSPAAVVSLRVGGGALVLLPAVLWVMRGRWGRLPRNLPTIAVYGVFGVAGVQFAYYSAVRTLSVAVALLIEYLAIVLIVGWLWAVRGQRPDRLTAAGVVLAVGGLSLVVGLWTGVSVSVVGVAWALVAAVGLAVYFVLSADQRDHALPPLALAGFGLALGAVVLVAAGAAGLLPMRAATGSVELAGAAVAWWVPLLVLAVVAAALAYGSGIVAARAVGPRLASFLGLTEVLFALAFAWLLLAERPTPSQAVGGVLIVAGVVAVRVAELRAARTVPVVEQDEAPAPGDESEPGPLAPAQRD
jgi:drug/metabolite transporter (DMT)-like permease